MDEPSVATQAQATQARPHDDPTAAPDASFSPSSSAAAAAAAAAGSEGVTKTTGGGGGGSDKRPTNGAGKDGEADATSGAVKGEEVDVTQAVHAAHAAEAEQGEQTEQKQEEEEGAEGTTAAAAAAAESVGESDDAAVVSTDIVIVGGDAPKKLEAWNKHGTSLRLMHKNEELGPQQEACLFEAAYTDNVDLAQKMIDAKVDLNCRRHKGRTPLHYCALGNGMRVAKLLAFHKADLTQPDEDGLTPEDLGREYGNSVSFLVADTVRADAVSR